MVELPRDATPRRRRPDVAARAAARVNELLRRASLLLLGDDGRPAPLERLATGIEGVDAILEGGLVRGRLVELFGPPGGGKTGLALALAGAVQRQGGTVAFVDAEGALDPARAAAWGVSLERLIAARPSVGEEALQIVDALLRARACDLIVVDSVAALVPRAELLAPLGEAPAGLHARLMSQALRRVVAQAAAAGAVVLFLNQQRMTFDEEGKASLTTTGGQALHFYAATRLEVKRRDGQLFVRVVKDRFGGEGRFAVVNAL
jgi:recombination protein RecA